MGKEMTKYEKASIFGMIGGIMMLIAGVTGAATWTQIGNIVADAGFGSLGLVFKILAMMGALGGLLVLVGALLLRKKDKAKVGRALITIGAGFGLIGLILLIILSLLGGDMLFFMGFGIGIVGLILSIVARQMSKD